VCEGLSVDGVVRQKFLNFLWPNADVAREHAVHLTPYDHHRRAGFG
jgi:hypothetical protein